MYEKIRIFKAKFLGPTNTRGARVSVRSLDGQFKKTIDYDYERDILITAIFLITKEGYRIMGVDHGEKEYYIVVEANS